MKTREKILNVAKELYNEFGVYSLHGEKKVSLKGDCQSGWDR